MVLRRVVTGECGVRERVRTAVCQEIGGRVERRAQAAAAEVVSENPMMAARLCGEREQTTRSDV